MKLQICLVLSLLALLEQPLKAEPLPQKSLPPTRIERQAIKASLLHEGMTQLEVEQIMGAPTTTKTFPNPDIQIRILTYRTHTILTKVSFINGNLTGVTTDPGIVAIENLPKYARAIHLGMSRVDLLKALGTPIDDDQRQISSFKFEQMSFQKGSEDAVNVILTDGQVEGVNMGLEKPAKIVAVILPAEPPTSLQSEGKIRIGMNSAQVGAIAGSPRFTQVSEYKGQPVVDWVYANLLTDASTRFTFIDNVLTRLAFIPQELPIDQGSKLP